MNICKKLFSVILIAVMLLCYLNVGLAVNAASPASQTIEVTAGESKTISMTEISCYGIDGDISYSNRNLFASVTPGSSAYGQIREKKFILSSADKFEPTVSLTVKVSDTATVGSTCVITFNYIRTDTVENGIPDGPDNLSKTITVKVIEKKDTTSSTPSPPSSTPSTPSPTPSNPSSNPATPSPNKPTGTTPSNLNLTELNKQIGIAQALKRSDYTADSWNKLAKALNAAIAARNASTQAGVDKAATNLKNAIAGLVRVDTSALQELLNKIKEFLANEDIGEARDALLNTINEAEAALASGDQDRINAAYTALLEAFDTYKAKLEEIAKNSLVEIEKPIEVDPEGPLCNIWLHKLWLILLIVSVIINIAFGVLTALYFIRRKKKFTDDMPLVEYNINDD